VRVRVAVVFVFIAVVGGLAAAGVAGRDAERRGSALDRLSAPQLVGQRVIVSYEGLDPPRRVLRLRGALEKGERLSPP